MYSKDNVNNSNDNKNLTRYLFYMKKGVSSVDEEITNK